MIEDVRRWGWHVAWFNLRFDIAWAVARLLIRRPLRLQVKDSDAHGYETRRV